jgi:hypothetical protein
VVGNNRAKIILILLVNIPIYKQREVCAHADHGGIYMKIARHGCHIYRPNRHHRRKGRSRWSHSRFTLRSKKETIILPNENTEEKEYPVTGKIIPEAVEKINKNV